VFDFFLFVRLIPSFLVFIGLRQRDLRLRNLLALARVQAQISGVNTSEGRRTPLASAWGDSHFIFSSGVEMRVSVILLVWSHFSSLFEWK
jgi:hypothetical protein